MKESHVSFLIKGKPLSITKPWLFVQGDYESGEIDTLPTQIIDWNTWIPHIFSENRIFLSFFSQFYARTKKFPAFSKNTFDKLWDTTVSTYLNLTKTKNVYLDLQKIEKVISERLVLQQDIERLKISEKQLEIFAENSLFQSKQDLLLKLKSKLTALQPSYEIQRDEFFVHSKRMDQMKNDQKSFKIQQNRSKQSQRDLFRQTNALTKRMDQIDPQMQIYFDKLNGSNMDHQSADFNRIDKKYQTLLAQYEDLKDARSTIMQKSRNVSRSLKELRNQYKTINQQYREFKGRFSEIDAQFSEIDNQFSSLKSQIARIELELHELISVKDKKHESLDFVPDNNEIPFTSPDQARAAILQYKTRLTLIDQKLDDIFHTTNTSEIYKLMEGKQQIITKKLLGFNATLEKLQSKKVLSQMFQDLLLFLKKLEEVMNHLLQHVELRIRLEFFQNSLDLTSFDIQTSVYHKNQKLNSESDLNRVQRAYFYYAFIIGVYHAADLPTVPINLEYLPSFMKTKQTFQKSTLILKDALSQFHSASNLKVVFFIFEESYDVSPITHTEKNI